MSPSVKVSVSPCQMGRCARCYGIYPKKDLEVYTRGVLICSGCELSFGHMQCSSCNRWRSQLSAQELKTGVCRPCASSHQ